MLRVGDLTVSYDVPPGEWVAAGLCPFAEHAVCSIVPRGFQAYARVFHPAYRLHGDKGEVRWAEVARANGRQAHPAMEWASITGEWRYVEGENQVGLWDQAPSQGSLPLGQAVRLAQVLRFFTRSPDMCWFAVWDGWATLGDSADGVPRAILPARPMILLSGPLSGIATSVESSPGDQRANMWWPEDQAWCVGTDIDLMTTYIGGSEECIKALAADDGLEVMLVTPDQRVTWDSDRINPLPVGHPRF
jgi:hypothetical protein